MSGYENVIGGKLKLKGKALDVKAGGIKKKKNKKPKKTHDEQLSKVVDDELELPKGEENIEEEISQLGEEAQGGNESEKLGEEEEEEEEKTASFYDNLTPAEKRYIEQREQIDTHRMAKEANKSHRDRIQDFNQYLANMSEHYDIPKVGPG
ncbi:hypothetical protein M5689_018307 [Euphorbia peplus]|nr:hypothetical protein M5689_018307 [Euphorbia peplus]